MASAARSSRKGAQASRRSVRSLSAEELAADQRLRMSTAMVEIVAQRGYHETSVSDVISAAGVSRKTFYEQFPDKEGCFLAVYDELAARGLKAAEEAYAQASGWPGKLEALIRVQLESVVKNPDHLRVGMVEVGALGPHGAERREHTRARYEGMLRGALAPAAGRREVPELTVRATFGGINRVAYLFSHRYRRRALLEHVSDLVEWAACYQPVPASVARLLMNPPPSLSLRTGLVGGRAPGTLSLGLRSSPRRGLLRGEGNISHSFVVHNQRERILDALTNLTAASGYAAVTIPGIVHEAAVSVQAFYQHFESKEDAFLVAFELGHRKALAIVERAFEAEPDWPRAVHAAFAALLNFLASEPSFTKLALIDSLTASARTAAQINEGISAYMALLRPDFDEASAMRQPPELTWDAIAGGIFELCFDYAVHDRSRSLPELSPQVSYLALAPFIGTKQAAQIAREPAGVPVSG